MTSLLDLSFRRGFSAVISVLALAAIALMEAFSLLWIALDRQPLHRPWWEFVSIALSWGMLAAFLIGAGLFFRPATAKAGFTLILANLLVFFSVVVFEIVSNASGHQGTFELLATYSAFLLAGVFAAVNLKNFALHR